jgi:UDP-N-acetylmuramoyl-L-alanyl-D-glutamate--2,6-diaminopimelate ligase
MLFSKLAEDCQRQGPDVEIKGLSRDTRDLKPGALFAAIPGDKIDGNTFIPEALKKGAAAILAATGTSIPQNTPAAFHAEPRKALSQMAARFYPEQPGTIAAITGTSGKTSVAQFTRQIWQAMGHRSAAIGTLGIIGDDIDRYGSLTTPDAISLHQDMQMLVKKKNITHAAIEASSHGLHQYRLDGLKLKLAAFTNLSRDHLDYHKDMQEYFTAKQRLFREVLPESGTAVVNKDIPEYEALAEILKSRKIKMLSFGTKDADLCLTSTTDDPRGQILDFTIHGRKQAVLVKLSGAFQGMNVLCATALAIAGGEETARVVGSLPLLQGVRGRMETVGSYRDARVIVDYAHKPDALENVLRALRPATKGRLVALFGCGGMRDKGKRPIMGAIAEKLADIVIVTDDNPRMEDPAVIRKEVLQGCPKATEVPGRAEAIAHALSLLQAGDTLVIAGKGHEQGQIVGTEVLPFDDAEVARSFIQSRAA